MNHVQKMPAPKKQQVATKLGHCKLLKPEIACPLVQPAAHRVPKPTQKPPTMKKMKPRNVNRFFHAKISGGIRPL